MLEIFEMNENGAGWVSLENASTSTKLDLELALLTKAEVKMLCFKPPCRANAMVRVKTRGKSPRRAWQQVRW